MIAFLARSIFDFINLVWLAGLAELDSIGFVRAVVTVFKHAAAGRPSIESGTRGRRNSIILLMTCAALVCLTLD